MPILRPIPIDTKGKSILGKIKAWLFVPRKWEVAKDYFLYVQYLHIDLKIPAGFIFDGASVPRVFWLFLHPLGILLIPSLFHDYAYRYKCLASRNAEGIYKKDRMFFDEMFLKISYQVNGIYTPDFIAWYLLRLFGWWSYRQHPPDKKPNNSLIGYLE